MLKEVEDRLRDVYTSIIEPVTGVIDIFIQQFGEDYVDCNIPTFEDLVEKLKNETLRSMGITSYVDSNSFGSYTIDTQDYAQNGVGKKFLDYIPDLNIINYVTPEISYLIFQNPVYIMVHFPKVQVTNEYDKFVDIDDLYVRVHIKGNGTMAGRFEMIRATYTFAQFNSGYAHSHMPRINASNIKNWSTPCLGTGPITNTMNTLYSINNSNIWGLFVFELSKYVTIESLTGVPYIRLESIKENNTTKDVSLPYVVYTSDEYEILLDNFILYCAKHNKFRIRYVDNEYKIGQNSVQAIIDLSNTFIEWYDHYCDSSAVKPSFKRLKERGFLKTCIVTNGHMYALENESSRDLGAALRVDGTDLFKFKGNMVKLHIITNTSVSNDNISLVLSEEVCGYIFSRILTIINYKYGRRKEQGESESQEDKASEKCFFI